MSRTRAVLGAVLAQGLAFGLLLVLARWGRLPPWPLPVLALVEGVLAAALSALLRLPGWWWVLQVLFLPAVVMAEQLHWPAWIYGGVLLALLLVYGAVFRTGVPLFLSSRPAAERLAGWLGERDGKRLVDLGSGTGRMVRDLARLRPDWRIDGVELAVLPWAWSRVAARHLRRVRLWRQDLWRHRLDDYDVIYAFLSPVPMARLWTHVQQGRVRDGWLVSNSFVVPGRAPDEVLEVDDRRGTRLYCYRIGTPVAR